MVVYKYDNEQCIYIYTLYSVYICIHVYTMYNNMNKCGDKFFVLRVIYVEYCMKHKFYSSIQESFFQYEYIDKPHVDMVFLKSFSTKNGHELKL